jgi:hypothetical protein
VIKGLRAGTQPVLVLGLSHENLHRLTTGGDEGLGEPIRFNLAELGLRPMTVVIFAAETEDRLQEIAIAYGLLEEGGT